MCLPSAHPIAPRRITVSHHSAPDRPAARRADAPRPLELLRDPDFFSVWFAGVALGVVRWLEILVVGVFAFDLTGSAFVLSMLFLLRMLPMPLLGPWLSLIADRIGPRRFLLIGCAVMFVASTIVVALVSADVVAAWHLGVMSFLSGCLQAIDIPVRRRLLGEIAGIERVGPTMALDSGTNNFTRMIGPLLGGFVLVTLGVAGAFTLGVALYAAGGLLVLRIRAGASVETAERPSLYRNMVEGLRHVRDSRMLTGFLAVTVIFNVCGFPFTSMIPVIGKETLQLGPSEIGLLIAAEGGGAFVGSLILALVARPPAFRAIYVYGVIVYLSMAAVFGISGSAVLSAAVLPLAGLGAAGFGAMQSAIVFSAAPPGLRAQMMGVLVVCIGTGPIGYVQLGFLADAFGAPAAIALLAFQGLIAMALVLRRWPETLRDDTGPARTG
jgi:MFS family permease